MTKISVSPRSVPTISDLKPKWGEFKDFGPYLRSLHESGKFKAGAVLISPPTKFAPYGKDKEPHPPLKKKITTVIQTLKKTTFEGAYTLLHNEKKIGQKFTVNQFKTRVQDSEESAFPLTLTEEEKHQLFWSAPEKREYEYGAGVAGSLFRPDLAEW